MILPPDVHIPREGKMHLFFRGGVWHCALRMDGITLVCPILLRNDD